VIDTASAELKQLAIDYWDQALAYSPTTATYLGDRRFDHLLEDRSDESRRAHRSAVGAFRSRTEAVDASELEGEDSITRTALIDQTFRDEAEIDADLEAWSLDPSSGPQAIALDLEALQPVRTPDEGAVMVARWRAMGPWFDQHIDRLRSAAQEGRISVRSPAERTLAQLEGILAQADDDLPLLAPVKEDRPEWPPAAREEFDSALRDAVRDVVRPALERFRDTIRDEILPIARPDGQPGLLHVPDGEPAYESLVRFHTSLSLDPEAIHRIGLEEVARIDDELRALGGAVVGTTDLAAIQERLRSDPALRFTTGDEIRHLAEASLATAQAAVPEWFGLQPIADCVVVPMSSHEEEHSTIAYYRQPATDGSRPGQYMINLSQPTTRPRYEAEVLAFHESVPGHHLQLAISQELTDLPDFRRHAGVTAFAEGWGLYTERLSDEMGLYSGDLDRIGILSFDGWRACRLVVDTGMHALGWTRQQSIDFMLAHTALAPNNIANEVDRYITWPGQALAYKLGQLEILRLRERAKERLGDAFDIRTFHDDVLGHGVVSLPTLAAILEERIREQAGAVSPSR